MPDHLSRMTPADRLKLLAFDAELHRLPRAIGVGVVGRVEALKRREGALATETLAESLHLASSATPADSLL